MHWTQADAAVLAENVPAGHPRHAEELLEGMYVPWGQSSHELKLLYAANVPGEQAVQAVALD